MSRWLPAPQRTPHRRRRGRAGPVVGRCRARPPGNDGVRASLGPCQSPKRDCRTLGLIAASAAVVLPLVAGCGIDENTPIYYRTDARLSIQRGQPGGQCRRRGHGVHPGPGRFQLPGPAGWVVSDRDVGEATAVPGPTLTVKYTFSPKALYSDGVKPTCDDVLLSWVAQSGRFRVHPGDHRRLPRHRAGGLRAGCRHGGRALREGPRLPGLALAVRGGALLPAHIGPRRRSTVDPRRHPRPQTCCPRGGGEVGTPDSACRPGRSTRRGSSLSAPIVPSLSTPSLGCDWCPTTSGGDRHPRSATSSSTAATPMQLRAPPWRIRRHRHRRGHRRPGGGSEPAQPQVSPPGTPCPSNGWFWRSGACSARRRPVRRSAHACRGRTGLHRRVRVAAVESACAHPGK